MKKLRTLKGFTLIELVIVITIMLVITTVTTVKMPSISLFQRHGFANNLLYDLNLTRVLSMTTNEPYRLVIGASAYQIQNLNGVAIKQPGSSSSSITYPTGVTVTPATTIVFRSQGEPYNAANTAALSSNLTLTVTSEGMSHTLTISPQTGFIQ